MSLTYVSLDAITRKLMVEEFDLDVSRNKVYEGKRLTPLGLQDWPAAFRAALEVGSDTTLEAWLNQPGRIETSEPYTRNGVTRMRAVPNTAAATFAEGEFNRFYIRGVCRVCMMLKTTGKGDGFVTVYRARFSQNPRPESVAIEGTKVEAESLLLDLRENTSSDGINTALGLPPGPNSGMSVRL